MSSSIPPKPHALNRLRQQSLPHFYPEYRTLPVLIALTIVTVLFLPIGIAVVIVSDRVAEIDIRYDNVNNYKYRVAEGSELPYIYNFNGTTYSTGGHVRKRVTLSKSLAAPVYIQYRLTGYYQIYRQLSASLDTAQLRGGTGIIDENCDPFRYPGDVFEDRVAGYYSPCGAIPWSLFNDSFSLFSVPKGTSVSEIDQEIPRGASLICDGAKFDADGESLLSTNQCKKKGIALPSDVAERFLNPKGMDASGPMWKAGGDPTYDNPYLKEGYYYMEPGHRIPKSTDEDFIVWADVAYHHDFTKMYRIIDTDLAAGDYYFDVTELYDTSSFSGEKHIQLVTRCWLGGRNHALGVLLTIMGCVAFVLVIAVSLLHVVVTPLINARRTKV